MRWMHWEIMRRCVEKNIIFGARKKIKSLALIHLALDQLWTLITMMYLLLYMCYLIKSEALLTTLDSSLQEDFMLDQYQIIITKWACQMILVRLWNDVYNLCTITHILLMNTKLPSVDPSMSFSPSSDPSSTQTLSQSSAPSSNPNNAPTFNPSSSLINTPYSNLSSILSALPSSNESDNPSSNLSNSSMLSTLPSLKVAVLHPVRAPWWVLSLP